MKSMNLIKFILITFFISTLFSNQTFAVRKETFSFTIIKDSTLKQYKRSVDVRLDRRITKQQLEKLAHEIKSIDNGHYERTFILYYLPYQKPDSGAWASTHFTPILEIEILRATVDTENKFRNFSIANGWQVPEAHTDSTPI
jgi:hypothetical protein